MRRIIPLSSGLALAASLSVGTLPVAGAIASAYSGKGTHPGFSIDPIAAMGNFSTMGIDWLQNGDMVWVRAPNQYFDPPSPNANAGVWIVKNVATSPTVTKLVDQFRQPTGVAIGANDEIMVVDLDGVYKVSAATGTKTRVLAAPPSDPSPPYHGYIFTPIYQDGKYYAPYSGTFVPGGYADTDPSGEYAGAVLSWTSDGAGGYAKHAGGLRSPNGGGPGPNGIMMFTDNQGSWGPSCALNIIKPNKFYGTHQNTSKGFADNWAGLANRAGNLPYQPPIAWFMQAQTVGQTYGTGASTTQPLYMPRGPYAGDVIVGDATLEGLSRIALDPVNGATGVNANYNGSVHWFTNMPGGANCPAPNRFAMDPGSDVIYVGTLAIIGQTGGAWPSGAAQPFYKITLDAAAVKASFEILSVKSRSGGIEIAFSQPVSAASAVAGSFALRQWDLVRQEGYGAGNTASTAPSISSVQVSEDGSRVYLGIGNNAKVDRVLSIIAGGIRSRTGNATLVFNQAWFTHNYQSTVAFSPVPTRIADRAADRYMEDRIHQTALPGAVKLRVDLEGAYTVALSEVNGSRREEKRGFGAGEITVAAPGRGLYIVQVRQGDRAYTRPVAF